MRFLLIFLLFTSVIVYGQKNDTIVHINGNILTGEIKRLDYGIITYKMDGMGSIDFQTKKVKTIISKKKFEIKLTNGLNYFGSIDSVNNGRKVKILLGNLSKIIDIDDITELYPIKNNFWLRMSGKFNLGYNFSKGSKINTFTFSGNVDYRKKKSYYSLNWNNNFTAQKDSIISSKTDVNFVIVHYINNNWSFYSQTGMNQASEMGLSLRLFQSFAGLYDIVYNSKNRLNSAVGLSGNREWSNDNSLSANNLEAFMSLNYKLFKYISPKIDITTDFTIFPSLSNYGRLRIEYNLNSSYELFSDFFIGLNYYYSFDSKPIDINASKEDWGISTTFGYSFH